MKLTKFGHSCVRLEEDGRTLVIDPGMFTDVPAAMEGAQAVLITHEHPDHIDIGALSTAARSNPDLQIFAPASVVPALEEFDEQVVTTEAGATVTAVGFEIVGVGGQHALIHPLIPVVANVGYLINGTLYHPGDSFIVPTTSVKALLVPIHAPWSKTAEVIDFTVACRAPQAFQIHDALLNEAGIKGVEGHVERVGKQYGTQFHHLQLGESVNL